MKTQFPRQPEHIRPICDEFCKAWAKTIAASAASGIIQARLLAWTPAGPDRQRIIKGARDLYEANAYKPGFLLWAVPKHLENFPECRYIPSPFSLRYLWEQYEKKEKHTDPKNYDLRRYELD